jgi:hypothetical protein
MVHVDSVRGAGEVGGIGGVAAFGALLIVIVALFGSAASFGAGVETAGD